MGKRNYVPNPEKQAAKREKILERNRLQEPIKKNLKARGCCHQEIGNLLRNKSSEILLRFPNPTVVRFCFPDYPGHWFEHDKMAKPFIDFVNQSCSKNNRNRPLYSNNIGGYLLFLLDDDAHASFVRGLLPELNRTLNQALREPTPAEIEEFHAGWYERSPNMFSHYLKGGQRRTDLPPRPKGKK